MPTVPNNQITDAPILEEYWTTRDGRKIAVGDMDVEHLRNTLRMILRKRRKAAPIIALLDDISTSAGQDESSAQAVRDLANPNIFFPLIGGGVYGSPSLQRKYGGR